MGDEEATRLYSVASLSAQLLEALGPVEVDHLAAGRVRFDLRIMNARALAELADLEQPRMLRLVEGTDG